MTPRPPVAGPDGKELRARCIQLLRKPDRADAGPPDVVVGVTLFNQATSLARCLQSIVEQQMDGLHVAVVLLNDYSTDGWQAAINPFLAKIPFYVLQAECGTAALARNAILDWVDAHLPDVKWVARLDADDRFTTPTSLASAVRLGNAKQARFVLGGNRLVRSGELLDLANPATSSLTNSEWVLSVLRRMAEGSAENELPSCNLLLATSTGWRYPSIGSAEDHWLVSYLLLNHAEDGAILAEPYFCDYSLDGQTTAVAKRRDLYLRNRQYIYSAAKAWHEVRRSGKTVLGIGQEGIVTRDGPLVEKRFYPGLVDEATVRRLEKQLRGVSPSLPEPQWLRQQDYWIARYASGETQPVTSITETEALDFLRMCLKHGVVCSNIKRANFRRLVHGGLMFIDLGKWLVPMNASYFMDSAARLYAISVLGWPDEEMSRRTPRSSPPHGSLDWLPGFADFYRRLMCDHAESLWAGSVGSTEPLAPTVADSVSLLIKACAMDAPYLTHQVRHIVAQLSCPRQFAKRYLLLDPFQGPFLRQYAQPDWQAVLRGAESLKHSGVVDGVWIAPEERVAAKEINARWFGLECSATHTASGVPLTPQLWAFEQIPTRYVLQCDLDSLIGRRDLDHDYLREMLAAAEPSDVLGVAFNIPHAPDCASNRYDAPPGDYVPEVRCGLLDLERLKSQRPLPNTLDNGMLSLSWYRAVQERQRQSGMRTLRGGDPRTFYVHPTNDRKSDPSTLARIRDLVGQGRVPSVQLGRWDVEGSPDDWRYPSRSERIVFLGKGRNTPEEKLRRWVASLLMQDDQDFGVIVIDDASDVELAARIPQLLRPLGNRLTLVRHAAPQGRMPNFGLAVRSICSDPEALIAVVDLDDALFSASTSIRLKAAQSEGVDVLWGAMFRPDKPLKVYRPDPLAVGLPCAGDVWTHLRAFKKSLFESVPESEFKINGEWIAECTDYATMVPMARRASKPFVADEYLYFHQRSTPTTAEDRKRKDKIIRAIVASGGSAPGNGRFQ